MKTMHLDIYNNQQVHAHELKINILPKVHRFEMQCSSLKFKCIILNQDSKYDVTRLHGNRRQQ